MLLVDFSINYQPIFMKFTGDFQVKFTGDFQVMSYLNLYAELQKLDHLTCSKLTI